MSVAATQKTTPGRPWMVGRRSNTNTTAAINAIATAVVLRTRRRTLLSTHRHRRCRSSLAAHDLPTSKAATSSDCQGDDGPNSGQQLDETLQRHSHAESSQVGLATSP
jgi:hypothetical protein